MQQTCMGVINRKIDTDIHSALTAGSTTEAMTLTNSGTFLADLLGIIATLSENNAIDSGVPEEMEPYALITPKFRANMATIDQFSSVDFINLKPFANFSKFRAFSWMGCNWIVDTDLPGIGTASSTNFIYSKNAIGHACNTETLQTEVGYDRKNDKSWARCSTFMGSKLLQDSGVIKMTHNDTTIITT